MFREIFKQPLFITLKEKLLGTSEKPTALKEFPEALGETVEQATWAPKPLQEPIRKVREFLRPENKEEALKMGMASLTTGEKPLFVDVMGLTAPLKKVGGKVAQEVIQEAPRLFGGLKTTSTKLLEKFRGMPETIKPGRFEEAINLAKKAGVKEIDEKMLRESMIVENGMVNLPKTAAKVEEQLVPLTPTPVKSPRWSNIGENFIGDGKYGEIVYQSPIKTSAGDVHFGERTFYTSPGSSKDVFPNYFSHIRYEDMADGKTRKILETQSDLMQKEHFAKEFNPSYKTGMGSLSENLTFDGQKIKLKKRGITNIIGDEPTNVKAEFPDGSIKWVNYKKLKEQNPNLWGEPRAKKLAKLQPYSSNDPLAQLRTFREEVKRAAKDGKDTLLVPSGETAMKIEGLGEGIEWRVPGALDLIPPKEYLLDYIKPGRIIVSHTDQWIITDILGEGKFKAVPKNRIDSYRKVLGGGERTVEQIGKDFPQIESLKEIFDISGKVDTQHFVYKLNEEAIPKEARKMGLNVEGKIKADNGDWWNIKIPKERAEMPVEAFGVGAITIPSIFEKKEENKPRIFKSFQ